MTHTALAQLSHPFTNSRPSAPEGLFRQGLSLLDLLISANGSGCDPNDGNESGGTRLPSPGDSPKDRGKEPVLPGRASDTAKKKIDEIFTRVADSLAALMAPASSPAFVRV